MWNPEEKISGVEFEMKQLEKRKQTNQVAQAGKE